MASPQDQPTASRPTTGAASKKRAASKATGRPARAAPPPEPYESVLSGRLVLATAICLAMVLIPVSGAGRLITKTSPEPTARAKWQVGTKGKVHVTLVTADYDKLDCADKRIIGDAHCAFEDDKKPFARKPGEPFDSNKQNILQPYRTTDGQLLLIAGLWAQPEIAMRLHREPPRSIPEKKLARFVTECEMEFLEEWQGAKFRWSPRDKWSQGEAGMVGRPVECHIFEGP